MQTYAAILLSPEMHQMGRRRARTLGEVMLLSPSGIIHIVPRRFVIYRLATDMYWTTVPGNMSSLYLLRYKSTFELHGRGSYSVARYVIIRYAPAYLSYHSSALFAIVVYCRQLHSSYVLPHLWELDRVTIIAFTSITHLNSLLQLPGIVIPL
jgi:hypothetical protein